MRARNKRFILQANQVSVDCATGGWDAHGISISNPTTQYLFVPAVNDWIAPQSRGTFSLGGDPVVTVQWGAPPGITQPAAITTPVPQQASIVLTDDSLPNAGGPITLNPSSLVSWLDGTEALPGLPNTNDLTMGLFRPGANRTGFSIAGVERFELGADYARFRDGTVANPSLGFLLEATTGLSRIGAGILGVSILGTERLRLFATGLQITGLIQPEADATRDLATAALRFRDLFLSSSVRVGANPAAAGAIRLANAVNISARNAANGADIPLIALSAADKVVIGNQAPGADGTVLTADAATTGGVKWTTPASSHVEGKVTAGAADSESVTWTTAFGAAPIATVSVVSTGANPQGIPILTSTSTTGATVTVFTSIGGSPAGGKVKHVIALAAT